MTLTGRYQSPSATLFITSQTRIGLGLIQIISGERPKTNTLKHGNYLFPVFPHIHFRSAYVKERVELFLYYPSVFPCQVIG